MPLRALAALMLIGAAMLSPTAQAQQSALPITVLGPDCVNGGPDVYGSYGFIPKCRSSAPSPDGRWTVAYNGPQHSRGDGVALFDDKGAQRSLVPKIASGALFSLNWSSRPDWFFVMDYQGDPDILRAFRIEDGIAVERPAMAVAARAALHRRYPCLPANAQIDLNGWQWHPDGRRILFIAGSFDTENCPADLKANSIIVWMIGDPEAGSVDPDIRPRIGYGAIPGDGAYAGFGPR